MRTLVKTTMIGISFLAAAAIAAHAEALSGSAGGAGQPMPPQIAALPPIDTPPAPYSSGVGPRAAPNGTVRSGRYEVPPDFDANVAMHPETSGYGPWPGPGDRQTIDRVPSHYNR